MRTRHVLVVDDEPINRLIVQELLSEMICVEIDTASNGHEAIEMAGKKAYDLILMDIQMPELDGLEATRQIRLMPEYACVPIIAFSANAICDARQQCMDAGMSGYLSKPLDLEIFFPSVLQWLSSPGWQGAHVK